MSLHVVVSLTFSHIMSYLETIIQIHLLKATCCLVPTIHLGRKGATEKDSFQFTLFHFQNSET